MNSKHANPMANLECLQYFSKCYTYHLFLFRSPSDNLQNLKLNRTPNHIPQMKAPKF